MPGESAFAQDWQQEQETADQLAADSQSPYEDGASPDDAQIDQWVYEDPSGQAVAEEDVDEIADQAVAELGFGQGFEDLSNEEISDLFGDVDVRHGSSAARTGAGIAASKFVASASLSGAEVGSPNEGRAGQVDYVAVEIPERSNAWYERMGRSRAAIAASAGQVVAIEIAAGGGRSVIFLPTYDVVEFRRAMVEGGFSYRTLGGTHQISYGYAAMSSFSGPGAPSMPEPTSPPAHFMAPIDTYGASYGAAVPAVVEIRDVRPPIGDGEGTFTNALKLGAGFALGFFAVGLGVSLIAGRR